MFSLIVTGTPCSGPIGPPARIVLSCASASRSAASPRSFTTALILPLVARMRATAAPTTSAAVTLRAVIASASSQALHCHSGLFGSVIACSFREYFGTLIRACITTRWHRTPGAGTFPRKRAARLPAASERCGLARETHASPTRRSTRPGAYATYWWADPKRADGGCFDDAVAARAALRPARARARLSSNRRVAAHWVGVEHHRSDTCRSARRMIASWCASRFGRQSATAGDLG